MAASPRTEAGAGRRRFAEPRLGYTRAADLLEAGHAARARMARGHPHGPHRCRRHRVARPALPFPLPGRAKDHGRSLVGPAILWPQAAAAGLYFNRENRPWPGLITPGPGSTSAARSTPANRPTRGSSRNSILSRSDLCVSFLRRPANSGQAFRKQRGTVRPFEAPPK
jgi:hypothetical protein